MQKGQANRSQRVKRDPSEPVVADCDDGDEVDEALELDGLWPRQRAFVVNVVAGMGARQAAVAAGYSPKDAAVRAWKLMRVPKVAAAVAELEQQAAAAAGLTKLKVIEGLLEIANDAEAHASARVRAWEQLGRAMAMWVDKQQVELAGSVQYYTLELGSALDAGDPLDELEMPGQSTEIGYDGGYGRGGGPGDVRLHSIAGPPPPLPPAAAVDIPPDEVEVGTVVPAKVTDPAVSYYEVHEGNEAKQREHLSEVGWTAWR